MSRFGKSAMIRDRCWNASVVACLLLIAHCISVTAVIEVEWEFLESSACVKSGLLEVEWDFMDCSLCVGFQPATPNFLQLNFANPTVSSFQVDHLFGESAAMLLTKGGVAFMSENGRDNLAEKLSQGIDHLSSQLADVLQGLERLPFRNSIELRTSVQTLPALSLRSSSQQQELLQHLGKLLSKTSILQSSINLQITWLGVLTASQAVNGYLLQSLRNEMERVSRLESLVQSIPSQRIKEGFCRLKSIVSRSEYRLEFLIQSIPSHSEYSVFMDKLTHVQLHYRSFQRVRKREGATVADINQEAHVAKKEAVELGGWVDNMIANMELGHYALQPFLFGKAVALKVECECLLTLYGWDSQDRLDCRRRIDDTATQVKEAARALFGNATLYDVAVTFYPVLLEYSFMYHGLMMAAQGLGSDEPRTLVSIANGQVAQCRVKETERIVCSRNESDGMVWRSEQLRLVLYFAQKTTKQGGERLMELEELWSLYGPVAFVGGRGRQALQEQWELQKASDKRALAYEVLQLGNFSPTQILKSIGGNDATSTMIRAGWWDPATIVSQRRRERVLLSIVATEAYSSEIVKLVQSWFDSSNDPSWSPLLVNLPYLDHRGGKFWLGRLVWWMILLLFALCVMGGIDRWVLSGLPTFSSVPIIVSVVYFFYASSS